MHGDLKSFFFIFLGGEVIQIFHHQDGVEGGTTAGV